MTEKDAGMDIRLLGRPELWVGGVPVTVGRRDDGQPTLRAVHDLWLLALLTLEPQTDGAGVARERLADTLWPANTNAPLYVNQAVVRLRRALGPEAGRLQNAALGRLRFEADGLEPDVSAFRRLASSPDRESLEKAVHLYRGPLLEGCGEPWVLQYRMPLRDLCADALVRLSALSASDGPEDDLPEDDLEVEYLRRALLLRPGGEAILMTLLRALARRHRYEEIRHRFLDFQEAHKPSAAAVALYGRLDRHGRQLARQTATPPQPQTPSALVHGLPRYQTSFVGREEVIQGVRDGLRTAPVITLIGPGGVGKTRLAVAFAERLIAEDTGFPGSARLCEEAWFVELSGVEGSGQLTQHVASVFKPPGGAQPRALKHIIKARPWLLVFNNAEHLVEPLADLVADTVAACPRLRVLVTSRRPLQMAEERLYPVPPLGLPQEGAAPEEALRSEAVTLLAERAHNLPAAGGKPALSAEDAARFVEICRRLDGVPFLIELAAAQTRFTSLGGVAEGVRRSVRVLAGRHPSGLRHQRTVEAMMERSYALLPGDTERSFLACLSVFAGGGTAEAAAAVAGFADIWDAQDILATLADHSLIETVVGPPAAGTDVRWRMLEMVRAYGLERLGDADPTARQRHADWFLGFAVRAEQQLRGPHQAVWLKRLEAEQGNLRAALTWYQDRAGEAAQGLRLAGLLWRFWLVTGNHQEGRYWLEGMLEHAAGPEADVEAQARMGAGVLANSLGDPAAARSHFEAAQGLCRASGDPRGEADALGNLGMVAYTQGDLAAARDSFEKCLVQHRAVDSKQGVADSLHNLGNIAFEQKDYGAAEASFAESASLRRGLGHAHGVGASLMNLGMALLYQGNHAAARTRLIESLTLFQRGEVVDTEAVAYVLEAFATLAGVRAQAERAGVLWGAASAQRGRLGVPLPPGGDALYADAVASARRAVGEEAYQKSVEAGTQMGWEQAAAYALVE